MKSFGAIAAGFVLVFLLSTLTDLVLESLGIFPPISEGLFVTWMLVLALAYRVIYSVLGGYVTARVAPKLGQYHANILGTVGTVAGVVGCYIGWDMSAHWYPVLLALSAYPSAWWGGKLAKR